jgi:hypothetical protein
VSEPDPETKPFKLPEPPTLSYALEQSSPKKQSYPPRLWWSVLAGVGYGIFLRVVFGLEFFMLDSGVMSFAFVFGVPFVVGALPALVFRDDQRPLGRSVFLSFLAVTLFALGTGVALLEGLICILMALPIFWVTAILGCVFSEVCLAIFRPKRGTYAIGFLPFLLWGVEKNFSVPTLDSSVSRSIDIAAEPMVVWANLLDTDIDARAYDGTIARFLTIPLPQSGHTNAATEQNLRVRRSSWEKNVYFDCLITHWQPGRYMRWTYKFYPDSFPKHAMDDHIVIGGRYFDLKETNYTLEPTQINGVPGTRLYIQTRYRVSTNYNWYSDWWAQMVIGNFMERSAQHFRHASEQPSKKI